MVDMCLCGSGLPSEQCCRIYHNGSRFAETAEILMRSRFTAYAYQDDSYLLAAWDNAKKPQSIVFSKDKTVWTKLEIVNVKKGAINDAKGLVEFKAYFKRDDEDQVMHELSRFKKSGGRWYYLDGLVKSVGQPKTGNDQGKNAPCGSGKKFKRCC